MTRPSPASIDRLVVDPAACKGIGLCAHLAVGLVDLDRWGFPVVIDGGLTQRGIRAAERAVRACPRRALTIVPAADRRH